MKKSSICFKYLLCILFSLLLVTCFFAVVYYIYIYAPDNIKYELIYSGSMEPEIMTGAFVKYDFSVPYSEIEEQDVIMFRVHDFFSDEEEEKFRQAFHSDFPVTHRVHRISITLEGEKVIYTKGDNNELPDSWIIHEEDYCGKEVKAFNNFASVTKFLFVTLPSITGIKYIGGYIIVLAYIFLGVLLSFPFVKVWDKWERRHGQ